jgi:hypothetical protein
MAARPDKLSLLSGIDCPADLRRLPVAKLASLAKELREFLRGTGPGTAQSRECLRSASG